MSPVSSVPEQRPRPQAPERPLIVVEEESSLAADERALEELAAEQKKESFLEEAESAPTSSVQASTTTDVQVPAAQAAVKDEVTIQLEKILEDGLGDYVAAMPEEARIRFLYKGQETATVITGMIYGLKVHAKKVVELIRSWLLTIPGVNKFFLEQEAKIKTDRVLELENTYREKQGK